MGRRPPSNFSIWLLPPFHFPPSLSPTPVAEGDVDGYNTSSTLPTLTCSLHPGIANRIQSVGRWLRSLLGGVHFSKIAATFPYEDVESTTDLASRCSDTLGSLSIPYHHPSAFPLTSVSGQYLTATCGHSGVRIAFIWPLQNHEAQGFRVSAWNHEDSMDPYAEDNTPGMTRSRPFFGTILDFTSKLSKGPAYIQQNI